MTRKLLYLLLLCIAVAAAIVGWRTWHRPNAAVGGHGGAEAPQIVSAITVEQSTWQSRIKAFGQVRAVQGADLSSEVPGIVDRIDFQSGTEVPAGTVLLRLRADDDDARLATLQATADLWAANVARDQKQFDAQAISRATLDQDNANLHSYRAQVAAQQALMLEKVVRAPFAGRLGIRMVDLGQYLVAGTPVVTLQALDPIYVDFNVPQQQVGRIAAGQPVQVTVDSYPGRIFAASVLAVDSRIDPSSRMASVRASLRNPDHALLPGMFAITGLADGGPRQVVAVPTTAVSYNPYGNFVYVLTPKDKTSGIMTATSRVITTGETQGDRVVVLTGLKPGETVVTAGQVKLRSGASVRVDNTVQPANQLNPNPPEE
ncbi:efflux RND transporter periplasmic adaptor subunit [Lichenicola cladoniae]|uniref:Efflux RND transporter periplasmic adaptor subunit n=1 Tax=Lichenicola cladoniae TaxID=1484109 RepID=A0A6M8HR61_9PROT|nr:efflux RND transporter periplasmic adaptor subunit [Lichenicola cladoniae]NPD68141.1 efflux RND transporter periplasmic adaptor subunit [Acetobacteraceae bacterium]QKE90711.1 efflux RND transporter periplasmic adaptor subunit [Lichenicola cladoniae]